MNRSNAAPWRRLVPLLLAVMLACLPWRHARAEANQEARTSFERGVEASRAQRWEEAREQFRRSLELIPKPSTLFNLAIADIKLGLGSEALEHLDALELLATPSEHAAMLARARILRPQAQALIDSKQATAVHGGNALADPLADLTEGARKDVSAGHEHYAHGRDRLALAAFERAYEASRRAELLYDIGVVADRLRDDTRAIAAYDQFVEALPDAPQAAVAQVRSEALRGGLREARVPPPAPAPVVQPVAPPRVRADALPRRAPPRLRTPRTLIATGAALAGLSVAAAVWLLDRQHDLEDCQSSALECLNESEIRTEKNLALSATIGSAVLAVGMTTFGGVSLVRLKAHAADGRSANVELVPRISAGAAREAGLWLRARF